eukprot:snap_masked-scaffold_24-processed-gene-5.26-mRNA-1 protein AED:1.00 eAED:1.00 QI:0/0/0/0/1/1/2/0/78
MGDLEMLLIEFSPQFGVGSRYFPLLISVKWEGRQFKIPIEIKESYELSFNCAYIFKVLIQVSYSLNHEVMDGLQSNVY